MRNLSYREASVALTLIAAASVGAFQLWFAPAIAATERDQRIVAGILERLRISRAEMPAAVAAKTSVEAAPALPIAETPRPLIHRIPKVKGRTQRTAPEPRQRAGALDMACPLGDSDPLCGALDK